MRDADLDEIRELSLFRTMGEEFFAALMRGAYHQSFPAQVELIKEGQPADFLHVVTEGLVELYAGLRDREVTMGVVQPVTTFILAACISDAPYLMSARTLVPSRVVMIPCSDLRTTFAEDSNFAQAIVVELAGRYRSIVRHAKDLKLRASKERLAAYLLRQSDRAGGCPEFELKIEKRLLASYLGMTPENLSRALKALRSEGVRVDGLRVVINDRTGLSRIAQPSILIDGPDRLGGMDAETG